MEYATFYDILSRRGLVVPQYPYFHGEDPLETSCFYFPLLQQVLMRSNGWQIRRIGEAYFEMDLLVPLQDQIMDLQFDIEWHTTSWDIRGPYTEEGIFVEDLFPWFFIRRELDQFFLYAQMPNGNYRRIEDPHAQFADAEKWGRDLQAIAIT